MIMSAYFKRGTGHLRELYLVFLSKCFAILTEVKMVSASKPMRLMIIIAIIIVDLIYRIPS